MFTGLPKTLQQMIQFQISTTITYDASGFSLQVLGAITGVRLIIHTFPEAGRGPRLNVGIHHGALTEGLLTYAITIISLGLTRKIPGNFFMKTWISSFSKLTLHILGSDITGGCMNPASVSVHSPISSQRYHPFIRIYFRRRMETHCINLSRLCDR